jgi:hypothetical protein
MAMEHLRALTRCLQTGALQVSISLLLAVALADSSFLIT